MEKISKKDVQEILNGKRVVTVYKHRKHDAVELLPHFTATDHKFIIEGWKWENFDGMDTRFCTKKSYGIALDNSEMRLYGTKDEILCYRHVSHGHEIIIVDGGWFILYYIV